MFVRFSPTFAVVSFPTRRSSDLGSGLGTITNDDRADISITDRTLAEGTPSGTTAFTFTVSLSNAADQPITVDLKRKDTTLNSGHHYTAQNDIRLLESNKTSKQIN